jgi:hypothetical protein
MPRRFLHAREPIAAGDLYVRLCDVCGYAEISSDPHLLIAHLTCPRCEARIASRERSRAGKRRRRRS